MLAGRFPRLPSLTVGLLQRQFYADNSVTKSKKTLVSYFLKLQ